MTKLFVSRTVGPTLGWGDQITDDLELCVLTVTSELIESLQRMERQTLALQDQNPDLAEVAFCFIAQWVRLEKALVILWV